LIAIDGEPGARDRADEHLQKLRVDLGHALIVPCKR
jgi:hypothetical protein